jgi:hypothetical protein
MKRHVEFLSWLYRAWGAIFALVSLSGVALAFGAAAIARSSGPVNVGSGMAASVTAVSMLLLAALAMVWAVLHLWVGKSLGRYDHRARLMALGLGVVNLVLLPFGTLLGAYACWTLLSDEGRQLFGTSA